MSKVYSKRKGAIAPPTGAILIDRTTAYGNPYAVGYKCKACGSVHSTGGSTLECYRKYLLEKLDREPNFLDPLKGKDLICWCCNTPGSSQDPNPPSCHGQIILQELEKAQDDKPKRYYAGIGSRETPTKVLKEMELIAIEVAQRGFILRSGGAIGADKAFERGCDSVQGQKEIFLATGVIPQWAFELAKEHHPAWDRCNDYARRLHARNGMILLGANGDTPVEGIFCWTPGGQVTGGTGQALRIAIARGIKIKNLYS